MEQFSGLERKGVSLVNSELPLSFPYLAALDLWSNVLPDKILMEIPVLFVPCFYNHARSFSDQAS